MPTRIWSRRRPAAGAGADGDGGAGGRRGGAAQRDRAGRSRPADGGALRRGRGRGQRCQVRDVRPQARDHAGARPPPRGGSGALARPACAPARSTSRPCRGRRASARSISCGCSRACWASRRTSIWCAAACATRRGCWPIRRAASPTWHSTSASPISPTSCAPSAAPPACQPARLPQGGVRRAQDPPRTHRRLFARLTSSSSRRSRCTIIIGLHVKDLKASIRFYEATLGALGHVLCSQDATGAGLGPEGRARPVALCRWRHQEAGRACRVPRQEPRGGRQVLRRRA